MLITKIHRNKALIPPDFDFGFYFKAIRMLLGLDHGTSTAKCVWVLYQTMHIIPKKERDLFLIEIMEPS